MLITFDNGACCVTQEVETDVQGGTMFMGLI